MYLEVFYALKVTKRDHYVSCKDSVLISMIGAESTGVTGGIREHASVYRQQLRQM